MSIAVWLRFRPCCLKGDIHRPFDGIVELSQGENFGDIRILHIHASSERAAVDKLPLL